MRPTDDTRMMSGYNEAEPSQDIYNEENAQNEKSGVWKTVAVGGIAAVVAVGATLGFQEAVAATTDTEDKAPQPEGIGVANVSENLSFADAFNAARAQVGPGGVFTWHGQLYNTYTAEEWNAMSDEEHAQFAQEVSPMVRVNDVAMEHAPHHTVNAQHVHHAADTHEAADRDVQLHSKVETINASDVSDDGDVHVVGKASVDGHVALALDATGDGQADAILVDINDNGQVDESDVLVMKDGQVVTMGEVANGTADAQAVGDDGSQATGLDDSYVQQTSYEDTSGYDSYDPETGVGGGTDLSPDALDIPM